MWFALSICGSREAFGNAENKESLFHLGAVQAYRKTVELKWTFRDRSAALGAIAVPPLAAQRTQQRG
jgi:hypothetical protein